MMNAQLYLLTVFVVLSLAADKRSDAAELVGGWKPIEDVNDPYVKEIADFAVSEHNKDAKTNLTLQSVVEGQQQVVSGTNYKLVIETNDYAGGMEVTKYEAVVWDKAWMHFRNLTSFEPFQPLLN